jgi:hypothetical protein
MKRKHLDKRFEATIRNLVIQNYKSLVFKWGIPIYVGFGALDYLIGEQWEQRLLIRVFGAIYLGIFILPLGQKFIKKYYRIFPALMDIGLNATLVLMVVLGEGIKSFSSNEFKSRVYGTYHNGLYLSCEHDCI